MIKVIDWKTDSGSNLSKVYDVVDRLINNTTQESVTLPNKPGHPEFTILTDDTRIELLSDADGYCWLSYNDRKKDEQVNRMLTCSKNRFIDQALNGDKQVKLATPVSS